MPTDRERLSRVEAALNTLLEDSRIGDALLGPLPVTETFMGLRRVDGAQCYIPGALSIPTTGFGFGSYSANVLRVYPFYIASPVNTDRLSFHVNTVAAGNAMMGIYNSDRDLYPTNLVVDAGASSHNYVNWRSIMFGKVRLTRGLKWIAILCQGAPTLTTLPANTLWGILGRTTAAAIHTGWDVSTTYGALPTMFPTSATKNTVVPLLLVRLVK